MTGVPLDRRTRGRAGSDAPPRPVPDLSVLVVTCNGRDRALATLAGARAATGPIAVQWLVADSASSDGTPDAIARAWSDVDVQRLPNRGFAAAVNAALARARGRYVLLLNPDVEMGAGRLADLVAALDRRPEVGAASVLTLDARGEPQRTVRRFPTPARTLAEALLPGRVHARLGLGGEVAAGRGYRTERSVDWVVGAFLIVRRRALDQVGGLDERFFLYSEELDLCRRLHAAGWDVRHLPVMTVVHEGGGYADPRRRAQLSHAKALFAAKHLGRRGGVGVRLALAVRHAVRAVALAPAGLVDARARARAGAELGALAVVAGIAAPPFATDSRRATR